jgi:(S)-sulfolactate dehydrogenase
VAEIVISEFMEQAAVDELAAGYDVVYEPMLFERPDELCALLPPARALIVRNRTQVRGAVLEAGERLEAIGRLGVGLDNIDVAACAVRGIEVLPASGANDVSVAEYVIAAALPLLRGAYFATAEVLRGAWPRERLIGQEIAGKQLGLVGYGSIARVVARKARALDMTVAGFDPHVRKGEPAWHGIRYCQTLEQLMAAADIVSSRAAAAGDPRPDRCRGPRGDEAGGGPDQRGARRHRQRDGSGRGTQSRPGSPARRSTFSKRSRSRSRRPGASSRCGT